jgi:SAM-dependent methyltransferase
MDLRPLNLSKSLQDEAACVLNYQPFIITDDLQTGVGYSFVHTSDPRVAPPLVFRRADWSPEDWDKISRSNHGLRAMYNAFISKISQLYPGGSLLDAACNNGYFPVAAELAGMRGCAGMDQAGEASVKFLNKAFRTNVEFYPRRYSPITHKCEEPLPGTFDVVCLSAIVCHIPDPLHYIDYFGKLANQAVLFWGQIIDSEYFLVSYNEPHPSLVSDSAFNVFPYHFNDNTRLSIGLFKHAMSCLGFSRMIEIPEEENWIKLRDVPGGSVDSELFHGSRHRALLFTRP